jgi:DNA-directed RNA polymerase specialized sigma24 family protein
MQVDESYADYVAARWSVLYRLAALMVGEDRADDVAQAALVRAYLTWPRGHEHDLADEQVKAILARVALTVAPVPSEVSDPDRSLAALPRRQRVVLVLRCFEFLSDADVARILGCGHEAVEADATTALRTLAVPEAELATVLTREADHVTVPLPPIEALLAGGHGARRQRRRRTLRLAGSTAVVLALALAAGSYLQAHPIRWSSPAPMPTRLTDLDTGKPPRTTYAEQDTLHLDGGAYTVLEGAPTAIASAGRWTYVSFSSGTVVRVDNERLVVTPVTDSAVGPVVTDRLGRYAAWFDVGHGLRRVEVRPTDPDRTHATERMQVFPPPSRPDEAVEVVGLTPSGDVLAGYPAENRAWVSQPPGTRLDHGADPHEIEGLGNGVVRQVTPTEIVVLYPPNHFAVGRLEAGAFLAEEDLVATAADFADPRGQRIVYADSAGHVHVGRRGAGTGHTRPHDPRLRLPSLTAGWSGLTWEDDDHVLLDVTDDSMPRGALVRCDVRSRDCEVAVRFDGPHLLAR